MVQYTWIPQCRTYFGWMHNVKLFHGGDLTGEIRMDEMFVLLGKALFTNKLMRSSRRIFFNTI